MDWEYLLHNLDNFTKKEYMDHYAKVFILVSKDNFNIYDRCNLYRDLVLNVKPHIALPRTISLNDHWKSICEQLNIKSLVTLKMTCKQFNQGIEIKESKFSIGKFSNMMAYLNRTTRGHYINFVLMELGISSDYLETSFSIKNLIRHLQLYC